MWSVCEGTIYYIYKFDFTNGRRLNQCGPTLHFSPTAPLSEELFGLPANLSPPVTFYLINLFSTSSFSFSFCSFFCAL